MQARPWIPAFVAATVISTGIVAQARIPGAVHDSISGLPVAARVELHQAHR